MRFFHLLFLLITLLSVAAAYNPFPQGAKLE